MGSMNRNRKSSLGNRPSATSMQQSPISSSTAAFTDKAAIESIKKYLLGLPNIGEQWNGSLQKEVAFFERQKLKQYDLVLTTLEYHRNEDDWVTDGRSFESLGGLADYLSHGVSFCPCLNKSSRLRFLTIIIVSIDASDSTCV